MKDLLPITSKSRKYDFLEEVIVDVLLWISLYPNLTE